MKNTIAIVLFAGIITGIAGCQKIAPDSDNPPPISSPIDTMRVRGDSAFVPGDTTGLYRDTTAKRDTVDFNFLEPPTKGGSAPLPELRTARTKIDILWF